MLGWYAGAPHLPLCGFHSQPQASSLAVLIPAKLHGIEGRFLSSSVNLRWKTPTLTSVKWRTGRWRWSCGCSEVSVAALGHRCLPVLFHSHTKTRTRTDDISQTAGGSHRSSWLMGEGQGLGGGKLKEGRRQGGSERKKRGGSLCLVLEEDTWGLRGRHW